jgi:hypothetical protein
MELTEKDMERLRAVLDAVEKGTATTYDKPFCHDTIMGIIEPKCAVCRQQIKESMVVVNGRKMHLKCRTKYKG